MAQNPNIDDATRERAMKFVADKAAPAKQRVVSKKELQESGLSLRDFLNKERGLTRRKSDDPTAGEARDKAAQEAADKIDPGAPSMDELMSSYKPRNPDMKMRDVTFNRSGKETVYSNKGLRDRGAEEREDKSILNSKENKDTSDMSMKRGGKVKKMASGGMVSSASKRGDGIASKGKTRGKIC